VEKDVEEHRYSLVLEAQEVGLFAQRYHVDLPRTQTEGQGNSGDGLHHKQTQVDLGWWEGGSWPTALPPCPARSVRPARSAYKTRQDKTAGKRGVPSFELRGLGEEWNAVPLATGSCWAVAAAPSTGPGQISLGIAAGAMHHAFLFSGRAGVPHIN
jgi:hypothetical protein